MIRNLFFVLLQFFAIGNIVFAQNDVNLRSTGKFVYDNKDMGVYNLTACSGAPSCGNFFSLPMVSSV